LAQGLELTDAAGDLTVVTLAPQANRACCSRGGTAEYNCACAMKRGSSWRRPARWPGRGSA